MSGDETLARYRTVDQWRTSYLRFWGDELPSERALPALQRFLEFCEATPDGIIDEVLRETEGGTQSVLRTRARRKYMQLIDDFEQAERSRRAANYVRSFMIHNGVAMNPGILR